MRKWHIAAAAIDMYTLEEWLAILSQKVKNEENAIDIIYIKRSYFHISSYVKNVKNALTTLRQQYCLLLEADIVENNEFRKHISRQIDFCNDICDILEIKDYSQDSIKAANEYLVKLEAEFRSEFPESHEDKYSWRQF